MGGISEYSHKKNKLIEHDEKVYFYQCDTHTAIMLSKIKHSEEWEITVTNHIYHRDISHHCHSEDSITLSEESRKHICSNEFSSSCPATLLLPSTFLIHIYLQKERLLHALQGLATALFF